MVGVGGWRVFVCVWGLCLGVVGLGMSLVCVCVCVGWACGLGMCVGWLDVCVRGLGVLVGVWLGVGGLGVCVRGLGVLVGVWLGVGGLGVLVGVWSGVCWWVGRVGWGVVDAQNTVSHLIETKNQQRFWTLFLKKIFKFLSSYRTKIRFPIKSFLTTFITHKTCFTTICIDSNQKTQKKSFRIHFQKFLQVLISYRAKISKFEKIFSDNFFYSKNMFHTFLH